MAESALPVDAGAWTQEDVAAYLRCSTKTVQRLGVPAIHIEVEPGKRPFVRYDPLEVRAWWEARKSDARAARDARVSAPAVRSVASSPRRRAGGAIRFDRQG